MIKILTVFLAVGCTQSGQSGHQWGCPVQLSSAAAEFGCQRSDGGPHVLPTGEGDISGLDSLLLGCQWGDGRPHVLPTSEGDISGLDALWLGCQWGDGGPHVLPTSEGDISGLGAL